MAYAVLKQKLLAELEKLPESKLREVLNFVRFLQWQPTFEQRASDEKPKFEEDPLLRFIGGVSYGTLAQGIDEELYSL